jgi:hypothetical protein
MILSSPVDGLNQTAPVTTTFDPAEEQPVGVSRECNEIPLPRESAASDQVVPVLEPGGLLKCPDQARTQDQE